MRNTSKRTRKTIGSSQRRTIAPLRTERKAVKITRLQADLQLVVPSGYKASVLLRRVNEGDRIHYSWLTIQYALGDTFTSISYKHTSDEVIRFDVPEGTPLSSETVRSYLFSTFSSAGDPPIVVDSM